MSSVWMLQRGHSGDECVLASTLGGRCRVMEVCAVFCCCRECVGVCGNVCCVATIVENSVFCLGV